MITVKGTYNEAKVFTGALEELALEQIRTLCDQEFIAGETIRIMPDVHAGAGCTIGTTMTIRDKVVPNLVGVDIGCGMETVRIKNTHLDLEELDRLLYERIPSGFSIREEAHHYNDQIDLEQLRCRQEGKLNLSRAVLSLGTLGGGNHFIEVDRDDRGNYYVVIHSGSRHLGLEVAHYYQEQAYRAQEIQSALVAQKTQVRTTIPKALAYCEGKLFEDYIHDMKLVQQFARLNRKAMMEEIVTGMKLEVEEQFTTIHNYIDTEQMILRKGAVSAKIGEKLLVPINMRNGSLICIGKGNKDWNCSAPHGAGRLMSRRQARASFTVSEFEQTMKGIYTTSVNAETLDECPMAYKGMEEIVENIGETAEIVDIIRPVYNFKAGED